MFEGSLDRLVPGSEYTSFWFPDAVSSSTFVNGAMSRGIVDRSLIVLGILRRCIALLVDGDGIAVERSLSGFLQFDVVFPGDVSTDTIKQYIERTEHV